MNVRTLCLANLFDCEASGYEIRKRSTEGEFSYFVEASYGSIYPALAKLEEEGLVTSRTEQQEGRPAKKVYALTEAGREDLFNSLFDDLGEDVFRSPFLLFARFAEHLPRSLVKQRLEERSKHNATMLNELSGLSEKFESPADRWVINLGIAVQKVAQQYVDDHMDELVEMAQRDETRSAAE